MLFYKGACPMAKSTGCLSRPLVIHSPSQQEKVGNAFIWQLKWLISTFFFFFFYYADWQLAYNAKTVEGCTCNRRIKGPHGCRQAAVMLLYLASFSHGHAFFSATWHSKSRPGVLALFVCCFMHEETWHVAWKYMDLVKIEIKASTAKKRWPL